MRIAGKILIFLLVFASVLPAPIAAEAPGHVTGLGGVFVRSPNPKALMAWYRDVLGIKLEAWGGATLSYDAPAHPPVMTFNALGMKTAGSYMAPSTREFMLDFAVDDMPAMLERLKAKGVTVLKRDNSDPSGDFAWILDPDGTKIELWQPKPATR
jgi:predicted enzyme related to lactoylglutathione lyase